MKNLVIASLGAVLVGACGTAQDVGQGTQREARVVDENVTLRLTVRVAVPALRYDEVSIALDGRPVEVVEIPQPERPAPDSPEAAYDEAQRAPARAGTGEMIIHVPRVSLDWTRHSVQALDAAAGSVLAEGVVIWQCPEEGSSIREIHKTFGVYYSPANPTGPWSVEQSSDECRYVDPADDHFIDG